jgi:hypothetical protein
LAVSISHEVHPAAWLIVASVCYRTDVLRADEALIVPGVGIAIALSLSLAIHRICRRPG